MRKAFVILFAVLLFTPALVAKSKYGWEHVGKLKPGTTVLISLWNGRLISGSVEAVGPATLRIDTADPDAGVGSLVEFERVNIRRIVRMRRRDLPDPERWMLAGTLIGGGAGLTAGVIRDLNDHQNYNWFTGAFGGAALGFVGSCAILAGVGVVEVFHHRTTLVYEDKRSGNNLPN
jgi:hypothetical protein